MQPYIENVNGMKLYNLYVMNIFLKVCSLMISWLWVGLLCYLPRLQELHAYGKAWSMQIMQCLHVLLSKSGARGRVPFAKTLGVGGLPHWGLPSWGQVVLWLLSTGTGLVLMVSRHLGCYDPQWSQHWFDSIESGPGGHERLASCRQGWYMTSALE